MNHQISLPSRRYQRKTKMAGYRVSVDIRAEHIEPLLRRARAQGITPAEVIHEALVRHLSENHGPDEATVDATASSHAKNGYHRREMITTTNLNDQDILGGPADCVKYIDLQGYVCRWNNNIERLLGYRPEDMPLQAIQMLPTTVQDSFSTLVARVILGETIAEIETQLIHRDNRFVDVIVSLLPWREQGQIVGVVAISRDASALKRRERDAEYVASVARACNSAVSGALLLADVTRMTAEWANAARIFIMEDEVSQLIVCDAEPSLGNTETRTRLREQQVTHPEALIEWEVFMAGAPIVREIRDDDATRLLDMSDCYVTITSVPLLSDGRIVGALSALRRNQTLPFDTQTSATLALVGEQVGLAITKARLLEQVRKQLEALETAIRYKDDFLAALSHELRTPLTAILGFAVMIVENDTMGFIRRREIAADIVASAALMRSLVNDLLNLIQLRAGQLTIYLEEVDIASLVHLCVRLLTPLMTVKRQKIIMQIPADLPPIRAERTRLEQVILNLLINANKYTLPEGTITISAVMDEQFVALSVRDTGVGVSPEDMERVFELFERGETEYSRAQGGAGVGLAVSRQITEAMGGTLTMESVLGEGSVLIVRLPKL